MKTNRTSPISRRHFLASSIVATTAVCLVPHCLFGNEENMVVAARKAGEAANVTVQALRRNVSALIGSGGNIAVLPGSDGNEWMHSAGATITAHENTRNHLSTSTRVEDWNFTFPPSPAGAIPSDVFNADKTVQLNGATIALKYYGPAHTDGDVSAYFTEADVLFTGDTWWNGYYPFIDYSTGGNIDGMIKAAEANLAMVTDKTVVVPGHGPVGGKTEMIAYHDMLAAIRDRVAALKGEGKSLDEIVAAKLTAAYDAKWGTGFVNGEFFTKLVYKGVG
jgi:glyoxylase-like metal-dependent hydrolase (beta-lactamase superfamily II)